ncbi:MAG: NFACT family protein [archaeon]
MKKESRDFTSLEVFVAEKELQGLTGARVQKVYQKGNNVFLSLYKGEKTVLVLGPDRAYLTQYSFKFPQSPHGFCMFLRKHLSGCFLTGVEQHNFDRVLALKFEGKEEKTLVVEMFSDGNIILVDSKNNIMQALHNQKWKHRTIKSKEPYVFPPEGANTKELDEEGLKEVLEKSGKDLVRALATALNFGGMYAEEICARAGVDKNLKEVSAAELKKVHNAIQNIFKEVGKAGYLYEEAGVPVEFSPIKLSNLKESKKFKTLSGACDGFFAEERAVVLADKKDEKTGELEYRLREQEEAFDRFLREMNELKEEGDKLSGEQKFEEAGKAYEKAKKARKKIPGLRAAIAKTKEAIESVKVEAEEELPEKKEKVKQEWFEKFRWFKSSDGFLVIGGKDATSNEIVVKKHMEPDDVVFHADITGAPFCIVKAGGKAIPENTLKETAEFAASYSKAWQRGFGTVNVYYVKPEQVTKEAPSGEFIGKGAFMIKGKKTYFRNTELKMAIGVLGDEVVAGPENAVKAKTKNYVLVGPGQEKSGELAKKIKKKLDTKVSVSEIQRFVPSGKGSLD